MIAPKCAKDPRDKVVVEYCKILGLVPTFRMSGPEYSRYYYLSEVARDHHLFENLPSHHTYFFKKIECLDSKEYTIRKHDIEVGF